VPIPNRRSGVTVRLVTFPSEAYLKAGVGRDLAAGGGVAWPVHGLRHLPTDDTSGWYVWTGDLSDDPDFFVPLHPAHLEELIPEVLVELSAPPGSRFLIAPGHRDVWFDESLLTVE
jgi:hypothetical protein